MKPFEASAAIRLHHQAAGTGPTVVCLHSSGSSSAQWRALMEAAGRDYRFIAIDFYGHGRSADYTGEGYCLQEEAEAVLRSLPPGVPMHLVGHSYGGAVALDLAVRHAARFASVTVFEPVLFGLLERDGADFGEITSVGLGIARSARENQVDRACSEFVDYWNGAGAWNRLPAVQQQRVRERIVPVGRHFEALFADPLPFEALRSLQLPMLVLSGERSPAPARTVCELLGALPDVRLEVLPGVGHMGPLTDSEIVNARIRAHLAVQAKVALAA